MQCDAYVCLGAPPPPPKTVVCAPHSAPCPLVPQVAAAKQSLLPREGAGDAHPDNVLLKRHTQTLQEELQIERRRVLEAEEQCSRLRSEVESLSVAYEAGKEKWRASEALQKVLTRENKELCTQIESLQQRHEGAVQPIHEKAKCLQGDNDILQQVDVLG